MRHRDLLIRLDLDSDKTLTRKVAEAIEKQILDGNLFANDVIPGIRILAERLGVSSNTIRAALHQLESEGWVVTEPKRGTFVASHPPLGKVLTHKEKPSAGVSMPGFDLPSSISPITDISTGSFLLMDGMADPRLAPREELAKAYQRALRRHGNHLLKAGEPTGNQLLREAIADWASVQHQTRITPQRVMITGGSHMALTLIRTALLRTGHSVAVENPGNRCAWEILCLAPDVVLHPIPVDSEGLQVDALASLFEKSQIRAIYSTPRRQFPSTVSMAPERAKALLKLAHAHRVAIIEDDLDGFYHYSGVEHPSLLSLDVTGQVIHIGSISRMLAPGVRMGYIIAPESLVERLTWIRRKMEWQGDHVFEWAVADLFRDGVMARHLRRAHKIYEARRNHLVNLLEQELGDHLQITIPNGGLSLWVRIKNGISAERYIESARHLGLQLNPPKHYFYNHPASYTRIGFSQTDEAELEETVRRLRCAIK